MLNKQEARDYYNPFDEWQRQMREEDVRQDRERMQELMKQIQRGYPRAVPEPPKFMNATAAHLDIDGVVVEAGGLKIVIRGELLKKMVTLVRMAELAELVTPDEPKP